MAITEERLKVIAESIGFEKMAKNFALVENAGKNVSKVAKEFNKQLGLTKEASLTGTQTKKMFADMGLETKKSTQLLKKFQMEWLSIMFMGQAVSQTFSTMFKDMIDNYKKLDEKGNRPLTRALTKLDASFTMLKFSIMDAMGPGLVMFIGWISELMMGLADMSPDTLSSIGYAIMGLAISGGALAAVGSLKLFVDSVSNLSLLSGPALKSVASTLTDLANGNFTSLGTLATNLGAVAGAFLFLWGIMQIFQGYVKGDWWTSISGILYAFAGLAAVTLGVPGILIAGIIIVLVQLAEKFDFVKGVMIASVSASFAPLIVLRDLLLTIVDLLSGDFASAWKRFSTGGTMGELMKMSGDLMAPGLKSVANNPSLQGKGANPEDRGLGWGAEQFRNWIVDITGMKKALIDLSSPETPKSILEIQNIFRNNTIKSLSEDINTKMTPAMTRLNNDLNTSNTTMTSVQQKWDTWQPLPKTVYLNVIQRTSTDNGKSYQNTTVNGT